MKIRAAVVEKQGEPCVIQEVDIREPQINEVRVKLAGTGVCHTDIAHALNLWNVPLHLPIVLGHEGAGIVESVGPGVTKVKPGDHVIISNPSCGECPACQSGREWYCEQAANNHLMLDGVDFFGTTTMTRGDGEPVHLLFQQSSFAEYVVSNHRCITKIPDDFDLKVAGPIGCGIRSGAGAVYNELRPRLGEWILILGVGTVGLSAMWTAKAMGAKVVVVDISDERLAFAKETGADVTVNTSGIDYDDIPEAVWQATGGEKPLYMVETTSVPDAIKACMSSLAGGGKIAQIGVTGAISFDSWFFGPVDCKNITIIRMGNVANDIIIPIVCDLYQQGKFPIDRIMTFYKFDEINKAIDDSLAGKTIKPVLLFD